MTEGFVSLAPDGSNFFFVGKSQQAYLIIAATKKNKNAGTNIAARHDASTDIPRVSRIGITKHHMMKIWSRLRRGCPNRPLLRSPFRQRSAQTSSNTRTGS